MVGYALYLYVIDALLHTINALYLYINAYVPMQPGQVR